MSTIASQLSNLAKVDFEAIKRIEQSIASDRSVALAFIADPDGYMKRALLGTYLPPDLHFHVRDGDELFPAETEIPQSQIAITTTIVLDPSFKAEVLARLGEQKARNPDAALRLCEGCRECKIAILR